MFSVNYESESGSSRFLYLIFENDASECALLRPSRAEVGTCYTVFLYIVV